ncbi:MAG: amidohydrolase [Chloroflexota bacterium]|nr:amidohydrolase [Chloroflexota bacterium]
MLERAREMEDDLVAWRRDIHENPELGFQETRTAARVAETLEDLGYDVQTGIGHTGVVGERGTGHPVVAIRADMDALPIQEQNDVPYASQNPGVMHACGHDCHVAIALGVATLLSEESLTGTVRFLFQPAEETVDEEGKSGAQRMIEDGAMEGVDMVLALHVDSSTPVGQIVVRAGPTSAGVDTFHAAIQGEGGHGAYPHTVVDPIHIAGHVILGLHGIVSRQIHPADPAVISIGSIHGGQADNVIPQEIKLSGTIRYTEVEVQETLHAEIEQALHIARAMGGDYALQIDVGYPPMSNDAELVELLREVGTDLLGAGRVGSGRLEMGAEDFEYFSSLARGAMFRLGCKIEEDERKHHSPYFDVDEACLPIGVAVLTEAAFRLLAK